jgi:hypothetical protein
MGERLRNMHDPPGKDEDSRLSEPTYLDVEEERHKLSQMNPLMIIDYVKSSFDILLNLRVEDAVYEHE